MTGQGLDRAGVIVLSVVADATARTLLVAALAAAVLAIWHQATAPRRSLIWTVVLCASLSLPMLVMLMPARVVTVRSSVPAISMALSQIVTPANVVRDRASAMFVSNSTSASPTSPASTANAPRRVFWIGVISLGYLTGVIWLLARLCRAWFLARRLRHGAPIASPIAVGRVEAEARRLGLARVPRLVEQPRIVVPMTSGVLRPVIALPADWREWPDDAMRAVLVHELTHVSRRDALTQTLSHFNRAIAWVNPLSWWLHRTLADLAEQMSDDAALEAGVSQTTYAETLLTFAQRLPAAARGPEWAVAMARQSGVATERRIDRVLAWERGVQGQNRSVMKALILVVAGGVVLATASVRLDATRAAAERALAPLQVSPASAPSGLTAVPLSATVPAPIEQIEHVSTPIERPWRRAPEVIREAMPSAPALTLQQTTPLQGLDEEALRAAKEWTFKPAQQAPVRIAGGFGAGAYRPGGGATSPVLIRQVDAEYSRAALDRKIEGDVEVEAVILADGTVGDVRVSRSLDAKDGLDDSAVRAARLWTFKPAVLNRVAVPMLVTLQMQFRLEKAKVEAVTPRAYYYGQQVSGPLTDDFANGAYWIGTTGLTPPLLVAQVEPKYTAQAMRDKLQGDAVVELIVMPDGSVGKTRMAISLDPIDGLDDNALTAAQHFRFTPGLLNGQPVPVLVTISLSFRLH